MRNIRHYKIQDVDGLWLADYVVYNRTITAHWTEKEDHAMLLTMSRAHVVKEALALRKHDVEVVDHVSDTY